MSAGRLRLRVADKGVTWANDVTWIDDFTCTDDVTCTQDSASSFTSSGTLSSGTLSGTDDDENGGGCKLKLDGAVTSLED